MIILALSFLAAFLTGIFMIPSLRRFAENYAFVDTPDHALKSHRYAVPYFGGVAVFVAPIAPLLYVFGFKLWLVSFLAGCFFLLALGLFDDVYRLSPLPKFLGMGLGIAMLIYSLTLYTGLVPSFSVLALSVFFLWTAINAVNLVDILDGLATTLSIVAFLGYGFLGWIFGVPSIALLALCFSGALFGFLWHNWRPAKIYLGDAGALFLGGALGYLALALGWSKHLTPFFFITPIVMGVFLVELVALMVIRTAIGIPFFTGSPHHYAHYLQRQGYPWGLIIGFSALAGLVLNFLIVAAIFSFISPLQLIISLLAGLGLWVKLIYFS